MPLRRYGASTADDLEEDDICDCEDADEPNPPLTLDEELSQSNPHTQYSLAYRVELQELEDDDIEEDDDLFTHVDDDLELSELRLHELELFELEDELLVTMELEDEELDNDEHSPRYR